MENTLAKAWRKTAMFLFWLVVLLAGVIVCLGLAGAAVVLR